VDRAPNARGGSTYLLRFQPRARGAICREGWRHMAALTAKLPLCGRAQGT